jgi:hypothetical protein
VRKDVVRRVWLILSALEWCSFTCVSAINFLMAKMYLHFSHMQAELETPRLLFVIFAMEFGWSALLCRLLYWRWIFQTETRLRLLLVAAFLGDGMWALCVLALLRRISPGSYKNLHVSTKRVYRLSTLTTI